MRLSKLFEGFGEGRIEWETDGWDRDILALSIDSRKKQEGVLFICLEGENIDSHSLVAEAEKSGAVAIVAQKKVYTSLPVLYVEDTRNALGRLASIFYGNPSQSLTIVGITGTNGKTTTSYMLASILKNAGKKVGIIGTLGVVYGDKKIPSPLTTPDAIELQSYLAEMLAFGVEYVVMEVSAHALYYQKTEGIYFSACIFSNFSQDHLDFFKTMDGYKRAKLSLFSSKYCGCAIVNGDDEVGREIARMREKQGEKVLVYGLDTPADCFAIITNDRLTGMDGIFNLNDKLYRIRLGMIGEYNLYNALAAATCAEFLACEEGVSAGLYQLKGVCGRLERVKNNGGLDIYVDFAHTPDGIEKCLQTLKRYCQGRLICLFGCGGNRDKGKRSIMGEVVAKYADFAILTSDNPRYEDPLDIIGEIERGYRRFSNRYVIVPDREKGLDYALDFLRQGDILLVAGKGGEDYQEIMGIKYPFNDQDRIVKLLE